MNSQTVFDIIGRIIVAGGGGALITFLMLKTFAKGWLDTYFDTKKSKLKNEQDVALAELKRLHDATLKEVQAFIDKDLHRARKLYDKEFEVLSEAWVKLVQAFDVARGTIATFVPQIDKLTEQERIRVFERDELKHWEIDEVMKFSGHEMLDAYTKIIAWRQLQTAKDFRLEVARCIALNGVFMPDELKQSFKTVENLVNSVLKECEIRSVYPAIGKNVEYLRLTSEGEVMLSALEAQIHERIWSAAASKLAVADKSAS